MIPQLPSSIDSPDEVLADPNWLMQEKFDGRRLLIRKAGSTISGSNKLGLETVVPESVTRDALKVPIDFLIDGEEVRGCFWAFDLLACGGIDLRNQPYVDRYHALIRMVAATRISNSFLRWFRVADFWIDPADKADRFTALREGGCEGVVFKRMNASYRSGRSDSQLKFKFVETASVVVLGENVRRSVTVGMFDGGKLHRVGSVPIPESRALPTAGQVVEVRYLYVGQAGRLYQPVYLGVRDDVEPEECVVGQLKYRQVRVASL